MDWILGRLALGNLDDGRSASGKVDRILNLCETAYTFLGDSTTIISHVPFADAVAIPRFCLVSCFLFFSLSIHRCSILVHCREGISRAPSIVIGYLTMVGMEWDEAIEFVRSKRPMINPATKTLESVRQYVMGEL